MFYEPIWEYDGHQLVQRPDTTSYYIAWTKPGTRRYERRSTRTADLELAKRRLIEFVDRRKRPTEQDPSCVPILSTLAGYVERRTEAGARTTADRTALKHLSEFFRRENIVFVSEFGIDAQELYVCWRRRTLLANGFAASNNSIGRELDVIRAALRDAAKRGYFANAPHVLSLPKPPPRQRFLRAEEVRRLLSECHAEHLRLFVYMAVHTLQRPIALFDLRVEQVDLFHNLIDFLPPGAAQTTKRRPVVPITDTLRPQLEHATQRSLSGFVIEHKGRPIQSVKGAFARACKRAGLDDVTPYTLRHTGATLLAASGVPMRQIAGMLGHSEQRTTELYAKHHPDFLQDAKRALDALFGGHDDATQTHTDIVPNPWSIASGPERSRQRTQHTQRSSADGRLIAQTTPGQDRPPAAPQTPSGRRRQTLDLYAPQPLVLGLDETTESTAGTRPPGR